MMNNYHISVSTYIFEQIRDLPVGNGLDIMDIGCGGGENSIFLAKNLRECRFHLVDLSQSALKKAKENTRNTRFLSGDPYLGNFSYNVDPDRFRFFHGNGRNLPGEDGFFDVVFFVNILHHTPHYNHIVREANRVLKKSGRMIIIDLKGFNAFETFLVNYLVKALIRLLPVSLRNTIFPNDLVLENGKIPLRSDVSFSKLRSIIDKEKLSIKHMDFKNFRYLLPIQMLCNHIGSSGFRFRIMRIIFSMLLWMEKHLQSSLKNQFDVYCMTLIKE